MEMDNKELRCEQDYFFDKNFGSCISCKETCDPYRPATQNECQVHCSAYLHRKNQLTTDDTHLLSMTNPEQSLQSTSVLGIVAIVICSVSICSITLGVLVWWRTCRRKGKFEKASVETEGECLNYEAQRSLDSPAKLVSSSLCQDVSGSDFKASFISIEAPPRKNSSPINSKFTSATQETQAECSHIPTQPKETSPFLVDMQLSNESACSPIDLQEDFDCVEQTYDLARRGQPAEVVLSHFSCDTNGMKNLQISAVLQRLAWVKQFWWDVDGAKIVVDASRQLTAKEDIRKILRREGIPSAEFSFELVRSATGYTT